MTATVRAPAGSRFVKNLGWLLRHANEVDGVIIVGLTYDRAQLYAFGHGERKGIVPGAARFAAVEPWTYTTPFASLRVCREWIKRHTSLHHAPVYDLAEMALNDDTEIGECAHCNKLIYPDSPLDSCDNCGQPLVIQAVG